MSYTIAHRRGVNSEINKLYLEDRAVHEWYRFVLAFPPHLVRDYLERFDANDRQRVLDPFCGTGTVLVECKKQGIPSVGVEANPMAHFASQVKTDWAPDPDTLVEHATRIAQDTWARLAADGVEDAPLFGAEDATDIPLRGLSAEASQLLLAGSISPAPLHKALTLLESI